MAIASIQLPTSPYLANVKRKFDRRISIMNGLVANQPLEKIEEEKKVTEEVTMSLAVPTKPGQKGGNSKLNSPNLRASVPASPYIGMGASKEQRMKQVENLKKHVQAVMNRGTVAAEEVQKAGDGSKNTLKIAPIENAFMLDIKNQRQEALNNMETLRLSVKMKKRANPLEKIMTKLMSSENDLMRHKPPPTPAGPGVSRTLGLRQEKPKSPEREESPKPTPEKLSRMETLRQSLMISVGTLQQIDEAAEDANEDKPKVKKSKTQKDGSMPNINVEESSPTPKQGSGLDRMPTIKVEPIAQVPKINVKPPPTAHDSSESLTLSVGGPKLESQHTLKPPPTNKQRMSLLQAPSPKLKKMNTQDKGLFAVPASPIISQNPLNKLAQYTKLSGGGSSLTLSCGLGVKSSPPKKLNSSTNLIYNDLAQG